MKISEIRVFLTSPGRNYVLVKAITDQDGLYGVGEGTLNGSEAAVAKIVEHAAPLLIGRDPLATEDAWQLLYHSTYWRGGPVFMAALGALDIALWDIKAKAAGMPLYQLLGGRSRDHVTCYAHADGREPAEVEQSIRRRMEQGFRHVRAQVGGYGGTEIVRAAPSRGSGELRADIFSPQAYLAAAPRLFDCLRGLLGEEIELLHDVHERLTPIEAARLAKDLDPFRLFYLEDPLRPEHLGSFPLVRQASTTPLAMGELFTSRGECLPLLQNRWIDYLRIAPMHVGGITEALKICALADAYQVRTAFHGADDIGPVAQASAVHLDLAIPNFGIQEWMPFSEAACEVMPGACVLKKGTLAPNDKPGHGVDIDERAAARLPFNPAWMPIIRREDGGMHVY